MIPCNPFLLPFLPRSFLIFLPFRFLILFLPSLLSSLPPFLRSFLPAPSLLTSTFVSFALLSNAFPFGLYHETKQRNDRNLLYFLIHKQTTQGLTQSIHHRICTFHFIQTI